MYSYMMFVSFNSNMTGVINGAGTAKPSGAPESTLPHPGFQWGSCFSIYCFLCNVLHIILDLLAIALSVLLQITAFDYPFGIFMLFLINFIDPADDVRHYTTSTLDLVCL